MHTFFKVQYRIMDLKNELHLNERMVGESTLAGLYEVLIR